MLAQLDEASLSAKGAATLSKMMKSIKALLGTWLILVAGATSMVFAIESDPDAPHEWVAAGLLVALAPAQPVLGVLVQLTSDMAYLLAADAAYQVAADVQRTTAATADYDGLAKRVYRVHTDTVALSEKMTPLIFGLSSFQFLLTLLCLFVAVGPRPPRGDDWHGMGNWYNFFVHEYVAAAIAIVSAGQLVWALSDAARVTSACQ